VALFTGNYNHIADGVSRTLNRVVAFLEGEGVPVLVFGPTVEEPAVEHAGDLVAMPSVPAPGRPEYRVTVGFRPGPAASSTPSLPPSSTSPRRTSSVSARCGGAGGRASPW
jgi:hypothetical protein